MSSTRLEAFSDAVIAIAITLLILDLKVPEPGGTGLGTALGRQWPAGMGFVISFVTVGIMWVNHHAMFDRVATVDRTLLFANLVLLLGIAAVPFTTALAARWLRHGDGARLAVFIYSLSMLVISAMFTAMWAYLSRHQQLLDETFRPLPPAVLRRSLVGPIAYVTSALVGLLSPLGGFALCGLIAAWFVLPARIRKP